MTDSKPLPKSELPPLPPCVADCRPELYRGMWRVEYGDGDVCHSAAELRQLADWMDEANGVTHA